MRIVFRADASKEIGSGHVMRSTAIAEEAIKRGITTIFVGKISELGWVDERIKNLGFTEVHESPAEFSPKVSQDILIIDSYTIPPSDEFVQELNWNKVVSIFDHVTPDYSCDLRIHPGLTTVWPDKRARRTLSGPMFVPLRKSIRKSKSDSAPSRLDLLVTGGGSDTFGFVPAVAKVLSSLSGDFQVTLFPSTSSGHNYDKRFVISRIGLDLDLVSDSVELVLTTASTTSLEFLARGTAVGVGCAVDNQELYYKELGNGNYAAPIGKYLNGVWVLNVDLIRDLILSQALRSELIAKSNDLIDLRGAERIIDEILKL
jgi:spore coat polysaccharide biosynthesis predicted glycosyltransferase SpsG